MQLYINKELLKKFEEGLNTRFPEKSPIPARIIGYGEISTVFTIDHPELRGVAFKRLPLFTSESQIDEYHSIVEEYIRILDDFAGIRVIDTAGVKIRTDDNRFVYYIAQPILPAITLCNRLIHTISPDDSLRLFRCILLKMKKIKDHNNSNSNIKIGLDEQLSNWAVKNMDENQVRLPEEPEIIYLDISTPLYRKNGKEMLEAELFLKSTPPVIKSLVKALFLQEVLDRYYDFRLTTIDLIANLFKEDATNLIPLFIDEANRFFKTYCNDIKEITYEEIKKYYKNDAFIWSLFLSLRKLHRFINTKILRRRYEFILPEQIKR